MGHPFCNSQEVPGQQREGADGRDFYDYKQPLNFARRLECLKEVDTVGAILQASPPQPRCPGSIGCEQLCVTR